MAIYPNLFIPFPWDFITLYFPLKPLVYFGHCGKAQHFSYFILGALTLTRESGVKSRFLTIVPNPQNPTPTSYVKPKDQLHAADKIKKLHPRCELMELYGIPA